MVAVSVLCAPSTEEARWLAGPAALTILQLRTGRLGPIATPEEAEAYRFTARERELVETTMSTHLIGDPAAVHQGLVDLQARTGADELMLSTRAHSFESRAQSISLVAEQWLMADGAAPTSTSAA
jgi:alkanesulfonate monooxygenase SsuD/methylene tetrahydromethanopterin reductase-like flavin-dependent oxidoreductase (luciferase family)